MEKSALRGLYVGILSTGTTSQLRANTLRDVLPKLTWTQLDTDVPFRTSSRWARSLAFRLRIGPAVRAMNEYVLSRLGTEQFEVAWIDKGTCLWPKTIRRIREHSARLIYYTPDTSFYANASRYVNATLPLYDRVVTTKSFELEAFHRRVPPDRIQWVTQSFDRNLHFPRCEFSRKRREVVLVGLCEPDREEKVAALLEAQVPVRLAGKGWTSFVKKFGHHHHLHFEGEGLFAEAYAQTLSCAAIGLGLLSKKFPEQHTTRTFEIPACGTALATERTTEVARYFSEDTAIFFENTTDLVRKIRLHLDNLKELARITNSGHQLVCSGGFSNHDVLSKILVPMGLDRTDVERVSQTGRVT